MSVLAGRWLRLLVASGVMCGPSGSTVLAQLSTPTYVGRDTCLPCHEREAKAYAGSHHDLAMQPAEASTVLGNFDGATFTYAGVTSTFFKKDGNYFVRTDGPDGQLHDYRIAYTFGVTPLQQYLVPFPDGRLQALSICWDTRPKEQGGQRWFHLYPDERVDHKDILHWTGPYQNWNGNCAECHSTNLRKNYRADTDRFATEWSEIDVSCEACHGPGSAHIAWAGEKKDARNAEPGSRATPGSGSTGNGLLLTFREPESAQWILDEKTGIAHRNRPRQSHVELETCARCHSRRGVIASDYVHGRPLVDTHRPALLAPPLFEVDGQIRDEVYEYQSFLQSKMHAAGVTCSDCHDPHRLTIAPDNGVCSRCHLPAKFDSPAHHFHPARSAGAQCVGCHMPAKTYMVVDSRRDHGFRVPRPDLTVKIGVPNPCGSCHADRPAEWAAAAAAKWWGATRTERAHYGEAIDAFHRSLPGAEQKLVAVAGDRQQPAIVRASALNLLEVYLSPRSLPVIEQGIGDSDPLVRAAALGALRGAQPALKARLISPLLTDPTRLVRIEAGRELVGVPPELLSQSQSSEAGRALEEYRRAQLAEADRVEAHLNLGALNAERGELAAAEREYQTALKLSPRFPATYLNLADLYRMQSSDDRGERVLREGIEVAPSFAPLHYSLGLLLIRQRRYADALPSLERAATLEPDDGHYTYVYAVAVHASGERDKAMALLEKAHARLPGDAEILQALASYSREAGKLTAARDYARQLVALLPDDPNTASFLKEIEADHAKEGAAR